MNLLYRIFQQIDPSPLCDTKMRTRTYTIYSVRLKIFFFFFGSTRVIIQQNVINK